MRAPLLVAALLASALLARPAEALDETDPHAAIVGSHTTAGIIAIAPGDEPSDAHPAGTVYVAMSDRTKGPCVLEWDVAAKTELRRVRLGLPPRPYINVDVVRSGERLFVAISQASDGPLHLVVLDRALRRKAYRRIADAYTPALLPRGDGVLVASRRGWGDELRVDVRLLDAALRPGPTTTLVPGASRSWSTAWHDMDLAASEHAIALRLPDQSLVRLALEGDAVKVVAQTTELRALSLAARPDGFVIGTKGARVELDEAFLERGSRSFEWARPLRVSPNGDVAMATVWYRGDERVCGVPAYDALVAPAVFVGGHMVAISTSLGGTVALGWCGPDDRANAAP